MQVNAVRLGTGEPLLLLHGIGHRWQAWEPILDRLTTHHEVIAIDLPGFGGSPVPTSGMPADMAGTVDLVREFLARAGLDRPHVAGYSLGGAIALELAAAGRVRSATAFSPAGFSTWAGRCRALLILRTMRAGTFLPAAGVRRILSGRLGRTLAYAPLVVHPDRITPARAAEDALALRHGRGFNAVARAGRRYRFEGSPTVPVTVAWGVKDRILVPRQAERARTRLPYARHVWLPDCGHVPMTDNPDLVATVILQTTGAIRADT